MECQCVVWLCMIYLYFKKKLNDTRYTHKNIPKVITPKIYQHTDKEYILKIYQTIK